MKNFFLNTNVVLDCLAQRQPHWLKAKQLLQDGADGRAVLHVGSLSSSTVFYVMQQQRSKAVAHQLIAQLGQLAVVVAVRPAEVPRTVAGLFADFEDGSQHYAAVAGPAIEAIVTRNPRDSAASALPVLSSGLAFFELAA